jgi:hypothetical protein
VEFDSKLSIVNGRHALLDLVRASGAAVCRLRAGTLCLIYESHCCMQHVCSRLLLLLIHAYAWLLMFRAGCALLRSRARGSSCCHVVGT